MNRLLAIVKNDQEAGERLDVLNRCFGGVGAQFKKGLTGDGKFELSLVGVRLGADGETTTESEIKQMKDIASGVWVPFDPEKVAEHLLKARDEGGDKTRGRVPTKVQETKITNPEAQRLVDAAKEQVEDADVTLGQLSGVSGGTDNSTAPVNTGA